jgi:hypothetical protein
VITTAFIIGLLTAIGFILIALKLNRTMLKLFLGYSLITDIGLSVLCVVMGASSGTVTGLFTSMVAGILMSLSLSAARASIGYAKIHRTKYWFKVVHYESEASGWASRVVANLKERVSGPF